MGPGRGTLSQDILRVFAKFNSSEKFSLHLVEVSSYLSELQAKRLCCQHAKTKEEDLDTVSYYQKGETVSGVNVYWYRDIADIPKSFSLFLAHEFFDALPIHKFQRIDDSWQEILIDIDTSKENAFRFVSTNATTPALSIFLTRPWLDKTKLSNHIEYSIEAERIIDQISSHIYEFGGFSLIMDYGHFGEQHDTFRVSLTKFNFLHMKK